MIVEIIMGIIQSVADAAGVSKLFSGTGRQFENFISRIVLQHYGFTSSPLPGAQNLIIARGMSVFSVAEDDPRYRPVLQPGEVALYDHLGNYLIFKATGNSVLNLVAGLDVVAAGAVTITAPSLEVIGDILATGTISEGYTP